jgi:hypothetical protein
LRDDVARVESPATPPAVVIIHDVARVESPATPPAIVIHDVAGAEALQLLLLL